MKYSIYKFEKTSIPSARNVGIHEEALEVNICIWNPSPIFAVSRIVAYWDWQHVLPQLSSADTAAYYCFDSKKWLPHSSDDWDMRELNKLWNADGWKILAEVYKNIQALTSDSECDQSVNPNDLLDPNLNIRKLAELYEEDKNNEV